MFVPAHFGWCRFRIAMQGLFNSAVAVKNVSLFPVAIGMFVKDWWCCAGLDGVCGDVVQESNCTGWALEGAL